MFLYIFILISCSCYSQTGRTKADTINIIGKWKKIYEVEDGKVSMSKYFDTISFMPTGKYYSNYSGIDCYFVTTCTWHLDQKKKVIDYGSCHQKGRIDYDNFSVFFSGTKDEIGRLNGDTLMLLHRRNTKKREILRGSCYAKIHD
ncbi:MAG: hypothetical protein K0S32_1134 [Bacteroidetes bacterium]|jgi:hypothetical protein|nr:hypothetical protein [Bacteroidota bacterium]